MSCGGRIAEFIFTSALLVLYYYLLLVRVKNEGNQTLILGIETGHIWTFDNGWRSDDGRQSDSITG